ncbi:MAG: response regulator, partial [Spirochaetes bacterium]|nr:response regulator [Spirochaetota bacterium]
ERASMRARGLTQQLLTFAKGGAPVKQIASIEEVIRDSALFVLRGSSIKVFFNFPGDLDSVDVDIGQFSQVIQNMVINAQHAMPEHGTVTISGENVEIRGTGQIPQKPGRYVKIVIADDGAGIPEGIIGRIFEPFFSTKPGGSGLGLASAQSVIRKHDGHIAVRSREGQGTEFTIFLPACGSDARRTAEPAQDIAAARGRVMIMDDEHDVLLIADRIFRLHGMEPTLVASGDAAVRSYREAMESGSPFRLAVLDLTMPGGGGGLDVMRRLRELDGEVAAVISSGYANDPIMAEYGRHGFRAVMVKPYRVEDVSDLIRRLRLDR